MTIRWTGPWNDTDLPVGQRISGWSESTTGGAAGPPATVTLKTRWRDGDPMSAFAWREMYGNVNYQYAQSRRVVWVDQFNEKATGSVDPTKVNNNATWGAMDSIYAVTPPLILTPNAMRGDYAPPQLQVKIRARRTAGAANTYVRVYAVSSLAQISGWVDYATAAPSASRVQRTIDDNAYKVLPGWSDNPSAEQTIIKPEFAWNTYSFPNNDLGDITVMETMFVIAGIGDGAGNGPLVAAIQVREEVPGA